MNLLPLPGTDLEVSSLALGTAGLGIGDSEKEAERLLDCFVSHGGNIIDTARIYSDWVPGEIGRSERVIGDWLAQSGHRQNLVLTTKGGHPPLGAMHVNRLTAPELIHDVDLSLSALRTDFIDLYWLHRDHADQPVEETIDILNAIVRTGKIRYFGASNWTAHRIAAANAYASRRQLHGFVASQPGWNIGMAGTAGFADPSILAMKGEEAAAQQALAIAIIPYSAQANGFFSRRFAGQTNSELSGGAAFYATPENEPVVARVAQLCHQYDCTANAVVLAYLMRQPTTVIPVIGCRHQEQLRQTFADHNQAERIPPTAFAGL